MGHPSRFAQSIQVASLCDLDVGLPWRAATGQSSAFGAGGFDRRLLGSTPGQKLQTWKLSKPGVSRPEIQARGLRASVSACLRGSFYVGQEGFFDAGDDLQGIIQLTLPDVASEDHAGTARVHDRLGVAEHGLVVDLGAAGKDHE